MSAFRFQDPVWMLLLAPLAVLGVLAIHRQRRVAVLYSDVSILGAAGDDGLESQAVFALGAALGAGVGGRVLARPQHGREEFRIRTEGIAIQMCIDRSGSMQATDFDLDGRQVDRLTAVKHVFRDFVAGAGRLPGRPDDLIGLVAFGGYAESKCPLTLDHGALLQVLDTVEMAELRRALTEGNVDRNMPEALRRQLAAALEEETLTAVGDAVALAVDRLQDVEAESKVIILLSDGKSNAGAVDPAEAAETAKTFGIKIYAVGIGSTGWARVPVEDRFGRTFYQRTRVELDEEALTNLAETTGGRYFNAKDTEALEEVYAEIDALEKTVSEGRLYTEYRELYQYAMFFGLGLILTEIVLVSTRFRSLP